ncbi:MAG: PC4/YdbC family ssDNA-binding protein [Dehalobacterium sp.]
MAEIKFTIAEKLGELSESTKGWKKELNLVSWNNRTPKYDIREWDPEHQKMGKGITLNIEELKKLKDILNSLSL